MGLRFWRRRTLPVLGLLAAVSISFGWQQQLVPFKAQDEDRELHQKPGDVLRALEISRGAWVADVGAGNGYYTQHLADLAGPTGKVFAEDIADDAIDFLHLSVKTFDLRKVEIIKVQRTIRSRHQIR